jgi:hypothetical protein
MKNRDPMGNDPIVADIDWRVFSGEGGCEDETIDWLSKRDPEYWHRSAQGMNWDWGWRILGWIVSQPNCSKSTAALIFWNSQPQELVDPSMNEEELKDPSSAYYLIKLIADNLMNGYYTSDRFPVCWNDDYAQRVVDFRNLVARHPDLQAQWHVALGLIPQLKAANVSQMLSDEGFIEGIPAEFMDED